MSYKLQTTAGTEDPSAYTATGGDDEWVSTTIALTPAQKADTTYANVALDGSGLSTSFVYHDGTGRIYPCDPLEYDLTKIRFKFGSNTSTTLYSLLTTAEQAVWDQKKTRFSIPTDFMNVMSGIESNNSYVDQLTSEKMSVFELDASKVISAYQTLDPTGYAAGNDFQILFPAYMYKGTNPYDVSYSTTKITSSRQMGFILDNVQLSTASVYFDTGLLGGTSEWYGGIPYEASIREPVSWIDIDLDTQKASFYADVVRTTGTHFSQVLFNEPQLSEADLGNRLRYPLGTLDRADKNDIAAGGTIEGREGSIWRGSHVGDVVLNDDISSIGIFGGEFSESDLDLGIDSAHSSHVVAYTSGYLTGVELFTGGYSDTANTSTYTDEYGPTLRMWHNRNNDKGYMDLYANTRLTIMSPNTFIPNIQTNYQKDLTNTSNVTNMPQILSIVDETQIALTSTTYITTDTVLSGYFTTPASGNMLIMITMTGENTGSNNEVYMSFQIDEIDSSGNVVTTVRSPGNLYGAYGSTNDFVQAAAVQGPSRVKTSMSYVFDGTENQKYKITALHKVDNQTGTFFSRNIIVLPLF
jgi:hypothetical protein